MSVRRVRFHGILLYRKNYREHDQLIKFLTAEGGKRMFLVRGANRPRFKMRAALLPFTYGTYLGSFSNRSLSYVNHAITIHRYYHLIRNITLNAYATYVMGLIDAAFPDNQVILKWFLKLYYGLRLIDRGRDPEIVVDIFEIQLLSAFGVAPHLANCVICGRRDLPLDYSEKYGGLLCSQHWHLDPRRFHLPRRTVVYLQALAKVQLKRINHIHVNPVTKAQLRALLNEIYHDDIGLRLRSKRFLDQMRHFNLN